jgi:FlaA1/EpsC-like NDP-sugar epimerase
MLQFIFMVGIRFSYRFVLLERHRKKETDMETPLHRIMLVGAGAAGQIILRDIVSTKSANMQVCCFIDDNSNKWKRYIGGVPIVGGRDDILYNVEKYHIDQIFFTIPTATERDKRDILNICKESGCEIKVLPGLIQLVNGDVSLGKMRNVDVEDLLGREVIKVELKEIFDYICGKVVLVTGGGGSIGSELCRQIAGHAPKQLIIFEIYENNAYDIEQELKRKYPNLNLVVLIGSVRDSKRIHSVFAQYHPDIVYHAAAHKHVPLMETSPCEAIKNNVMGTYKTAYAALKYGCQRFVLISTDKAVNPTNIMGASKRLCEMVIQSMDRVSKENNETMLPRANYHFEDDDAFIQKQAEGVYGTKEKPFCTEFVAVRFGNVLGSNGSVIPLFKKQIEQGGPVTVTHPDIIRYFMTIPEAVSLVLQAGTYAKGGEIFVLDMGEPVKIDTLARNLIKLSGFKPDEDIKVIYTGLRPGEKLYEEKLMAEEGMEKTKNQLIHIGKPIPFKVENFFQQMENLAKECYGNSPRIYEDVAAIVSTFHPTKDQVSRGIAQEAVDHALAEAALTEEVLV